MSNFNWKMLNSAVMDWYFFSWGARIVFFWEKTKNLPQHTKDNHPRKNSTKTMESDAIWSGFQGGKILTLVPTWCRQSTEQKPKLAVRKSPMMKRRMRMRTWGKSAVLIPRRWWRALQRKKNHHRWEKNDKIYRQLIRIVRTDPTIRIDARGGKWEKKCVRKSWDNIECQVRQADWLIPPSRIFKKGSAEAHIFWTMQTSINQENSSFESPDEPTKQNNSKHDGKLQDILPHFPLFSKKGKRPGLVKKILKTSPWFE